MYEAGVNYWQDNNSCCKWHATSCPVGHCSVLFLSRPRSEGWPHHGRTWTLISRILLN